MVYIKKYERGDKKMRTSKFMVMILVLIISLLPVFVQAAPLAPICDCGGAMVYKSGTYGIELGEYRDCTHGNVDWDVRVAWYKYSGYKCTSCGYEAFDENFYRYTWECVYD